MASFSCRALLMVSFVLPATAQAQSAPGGASVVIVSAKGKGGPNLSPQVKKLIEKPLGKQAKIVPFATYQKAAKRVGVKGAAVNAVESAVTIGTEAGATHVLIIEGQTDKQKVGKKTKQTTYAAVTMIEMATGDVVLKNRYELKAKKIDAKVAGFMLTEISGALTKPATPPPAPADNPSPAPPEAPAPPPEGTAATDVPPPPPDQPPAPEGTPASAPADATATGTEPKPAEPAPVEPAPVIAALSTPPVSDTASVTVSDTSTRRKRWRPALHLGIGGILLQRTASIKSEGAKPPGYEGPLPGGFFQLSFFPLAIGGKGSMLEGIGINAEGHFMRVQTVVNDTTKQAVDSDVVGAGGGLSYRLVFWDSDTAPDFTLKVGYSSFRFPLKEGAFPGTRYGMINAGGAFTIPLMRQIAVILGGAYETRLAAGMKAKTKLGKVSSQMAFKGEGGVRLFFDPIEITAFGRFEQFTSKYTGTTALAEPQTQYANVTLNDRYLGGFVTAGVAF
jgi:hypothetical protein